MARVSIIIPVYGTQMYLPACLDSVLAQTLDDIEIICIDDASPDRCGQILDEYAARDSRVKVIHLRENRRQGYGRNLGMEAASGEYVYFLDSDDMITPDAMRELYELAKRDSLDGIFFDAQVIYESQEFARAFADEKMERTGEYEDRIYTGAELLDAFCDQDEWSVYVQRQFWRRAYLERENIRMPEEMYEDEVFSFEAILLAKRTRYINKTYFIRRCRGNSFVTSACTAQKFYGLFMAYGYMDQFVQAHGLCREATDRILARIYQWMIWVYDSLPDKEGLESYFKTPQSRQLYRFFASTKKAELYYRFMRRELKEALKLYKRICIYGAGRLSRMMAKHLDCEGLCIDCFVVTKKEGNPDAMFGRPVISIDELKPDQDTIVVVAVATALQKEIVPLLEERRARYILRNAGTVVSFD